MKVEQQKEHQWLQRFVGEWTFEAEAVMAPGQPPVKSTGSEIIRSLGGVWIIGEGEGQMPDGGPAQNVITLGFDPAKKRFVGSWVGSMMANMWLYDGSLDPAGRILTLDSEGPGFSDQSKPGKYRDLFEVVSYDHRVLTSEVLDDDGKWNQFMTAHYRRTK